jgi:hypothetical protein
MQAVQSVESHKARNHCSLRPCSPICAIKSHADYLPDCPRVQVLHKALYACDELCGLITAAALVRPTGSPT